MSKPPFTYCKAEPFAPGDIVRTPRGRLADVLGYGIDGRVRLKYREWGMGTVDLPAKLLTPATPRAPNGK